MSGHILGATNMMSNRYDPCPPEDYGLVSESDINQNNTPTNYNL